MALICFLGIVIEAIPKGFLPSVVIKLKFQEI